MTHKAIAEPACPCGRASLAAHRADGRYVWLCDRIVWWSGEPVRARKVGTDFDGDLVVYHPDGTRLFVGPEHFDVPDRSSVVLQECAIGPTK